MLLMYGEPAGGRTQDPRLKRAMLYQLSYRLTQMEGQDCTIDDWPLTREEMNLLPRT